MARPAPRHREVPAKPGPTSGARSSKGRTLAIPGGVSGGHVRTHWNGIEIEIWWNADYLVYDDRTHMAHLEVVSVSPKRAPLPITETGYRSHFTPKAALDGYDSAEAFVEAWLDHESRSPEWKAYDHASRQLSLF